MQIFKITEGKNLTFFFDFYLLFSKKIKKLISWETTDLICINIQFSSTTALWFTMIDRYTSDNKYIILKVLKNLKYHRITGNHLLCNGNEDPSEEIIKLIWCEQDETQNQGKSEFEAFKSCQSSIVTIYMMIV